ncbi:uncharacterized protein LOC131009683 [Salvia miltiorrhiza]|uniref:uncharacterized protein LOC131009683 n=1 Tax=Salvia miltiorrhiza TaxID=226208 RepID=UPI0025ACCEE7|nr:uncharacterized protein LOC131009683 [Salvia miltiorrhiza]
MERGGPSRDSELLSGPEERTERESNLIDISTIVNTANQSEDGFCLVGSLITAKAPNGFHLMEIMRKSWKTSKNFEAKEWRKNLFLFSFATLEDRQWVLQRQPWHFDGHLFAVMGLDDSAQPSDIRVNRSSFWVRAYNLPIKCMNPSIIRNIGKQIGVVEEVDERANYAGCFARFKVNFDVTTPLLRGLTICLEAKQLWIPLKYEHLPTFCYKCGVMGHHSRACDINVEDDESGKQFEDIIYGPILKASPLKRLRPTKQNHDRPRKSNPLIDLQCHAPFHPPVHPSKPRPSPLSPNPSSHLSNFPNPMTLPSNADTVNPDRNHSHKMQKDNTLPQKHSPAPTGQKPPTKSEAKISQVFSKTQTSLTTATESQPKARATPQNRGPFAPTETIIPTVDIAKLLNIDLPPKQQANNTQKPTLKTWSRLNRSPTPKIPKVQSLAKPNRKRYLIENEGNTSPSRDAAIDMVQKRLKGTILDDDSTTSNATTAEIALEQSRRAQ